MKNYIGSMTAEFYRWFNILNDNYFDGELPEPMITIQKTKKTIAGYFTVDRVWEPLNIKESDNDSDSNDDNSAVNIIPAKEEDKKYEICISALHLNRSSEEIVSTLLHEMCHYKNTMMGTKDCSGRVHNKKFKERAESVGLICENAKGVGYGLTSPSEPLKEFIKNTVKPNMESFIYYRVDPVKDKPNKEPAKKFQYECPKCHRKFKSKESDWQIICKTCGCDFDVDEV